MFFRLFIFWLSIAFTGSRLLAFEKTKKESPLPSVASFSVASDEILFHLLLDASGASLLKKPKFEVVAWSRFVCSSAYSYLQKAGYCSQNKKLFATPKVGNEIETVLVEKPTHAILASFNRPIYKKILRKKKVSTFTLQKFGSLEDQWKQLEGVANLLGLTKKGKAHLQNLKAYWKHKKPVLCNGKKPTVVILSSQGKSPGVYGQGTLIHSYFNEAGFENLVVSKMKKKGLVKLNPLKKKALNPDFWVLQEGWPHTGLPKSDVLFVSSAIYAGSLYAASFTHGQWAEFVGQSFKCKNLG